MDHVDDREEHRILLGKVVVDSGVLVVGDPTYLAVADLHDLVGRYVLPAEFGAEVPAGCGKVPCVVGVQLESDGTYLVWGETTPDGTRLARVLIELTDDSVAHDSGTAELSSS